MSPLKPYLSGNPPAEKTKFMQTCSRLSLFLKEKGNIRDINFDFNPKLLDATGVSATVDLLSNIDDVEKVASDDCLPKYVILESFCEPEAVDPTAVTKLSQMTIFYQGQVMVLDDVSADRARDLILVANNGRKVGSSSKSAVAVSESKDSDLPIARRASLHKFLAKRKDRATVRGAPYHLQSPGPGPSPGGTSSSGNQHTFDLNM
ncbi:hypothetical protein E3N88_21493 [Mikania micrantha]|uniref:Protein TIFY n=1 Tax=Mikania micrantha TaxID=192012 RepID=A0A5N6NLM4_9ASTR|nr:hypothetical protein E3N88_21493 [Mikania micrantha]